MHPPRGIRALEGNSGRHFSVAFQAKIVALLQRKSGGDTAFPDVRDTKGSPERNIAFTPDSGSHRPAVTTVSTK